MLEEEDSIKSKLQTVQDCLNNVESNEKEYNSPMYVTGIFSYEKTYACKFIRVWKTFICKLY